MTDWSATNQTALAGEHIREVYFVYLDILNATFRACTGAKTLAFGGNNYLGIGEIAGISDIADAADIAARPITLVLSGIDSWIAEPLLSRTNYKGRDAFIYKGFLDANHDLLADPDVIWSGRMDVGSMVYGDTYTAKMVCEPDAARLLRQNMSRYSDEDHTLRHPTDSFFEFLAQMEKKDVTWGGTRVSPAGGGDISSGNSKQARRQKN